VSDAPAPPPKDALLEAVLAPGESILWSGRPRVGLAPGDGEAAAVAAVTAFAVLGIASLVFGLDVSVGIPSIGLPIAALAGCVLGLALTATRVAAAGKPLTVGLAALSPVFCVALLRGGVDRAMALICPAGALLFLLMWVALRWVEHRSTRYYLTRKRGFIEEPGRYVIAFELEGAPVARPDPLARGRLGTIELTAARGSIRTRQGLSMPVPATRRRFVRVPFPLEVVREWETRRG
jgi:hypothetical protein